MKQLFVFLTILFVCATAQAQEVYEYEEKADITARQGVNGTEQENFTYDALDRLTEVYTTSGAGDMETEYEANGNIGYKTGIGSYLYDTQKRHAVAQTSQMPAIGEERRKVQEVTYNPHGMPAYMEEGDNILTLYYGPDNQRWQTTLMTDGAIGKTLRFLGDYEVVDSGGVKREYWYVAFGLINMNAEFKREQSDARIHYPPTPAMQNMKMYPSYQQILNNISK